MTPTPDAFTIRPTTPADVPLLLTMIRELAEYEKLDVCVVATEETLRASLFEGRPVAEAMIGDYDGRPAAFMLFFHNFSTFLGQPGIYMEDLYVRPEYRGKGLGKKMLTHLARVAVERNCGRIEWAVLDWNAPAIGFYQSLGAEAMDDWRIFRVTGDTLKSLAAR